MKKSIVLLLLAIIFYVTACSDSTNESAEIQEQERVQETQESSQTTEEVAQDLFSQIQSELGDWIPFHYETIELTFKSAEADLNKTECDLYIDYKATLAGNTMTGELYYHFIRSHPDENWSCDDIDRKQNE